MDSNQPLVTIGLPVYNGVSHLKVALTSLLAQDYANIELLISDNASQDGTAELCRSLIEKYPHAHYRCNAENVGPLLNFLGLVERANGKYFMWASHDDKWDPHFVAALVERLEAEPNAVLATPTVLNVNENGELRKEALDRPSPGKSAIENLKILFDDHAASWVYGIYRTDWLQQHVHEWKAYPLWGADILWLADVCVRFPVVGNQEALMFKRFRPSGYAPKNARQAVAYWGAMSWHLTRIGIRRLEGRQRLKMILLSWKYVYRICIRRSHLLRTVWRVVRMLTIAAITSIPVAAAGGWNRLARRLALKRAV